MILRYYIAFSSLSVTSVMRFENGCSQAMKIGDRPSACGRYENVFITAIMKTSQLWQLGHW